jgi:hypothetical protein
VHAASAHASQADESPAQTTAFNAAVPRTSLAPAAPRVYLVDSARQASDTQAELDDATLIARAGQPPAATVTVVAPAEAAAAYQVIDDLNRTRATLHLPEIVVVDLRTTDTSTVPQQSPPSCPVPGVALVNC